MILIRTWLVDPRCFKGSWVAGWVLLFQVLHIVLLSYPENAEISKWCFQESPQVQVWAEGETEQLLFTFYLLWAGLNKSYCYTDNIQTLAVLFSTSTAQITLSFFTPSLTFSFFYTISLFPPWITLVYLFPASPYRWKCGSTKVLTRSGVFIPLFFHQEVFNHFSFPNPFCCFTLPGSELM